MQTKKLHVVVTKDHIREAEMLLDKGESPVCLCCPVSLAICYAMGVEFTDGLVLTTGPVIKFFEKYEMEDALLDVRNPAESFVSSFDYWFARRDNPEINKPAPIEFDIEAPVALIREGV